MAKAKKNTPNWGAVKTITEDMADKDRQRQKQKEFEPKLALKLSQILERETDTRPLHLAHVESLGESIAVLGLLEPLVVDIRNRLLAGGHRLAAIRLVKETKPQAYQTHFPNEAIPVRIMPFDAQEDPAKALQCEVAENEHRRDYTPKEVRELAEKLKQAGYSNSAHRPKKGEKALVPALKIIIGKSRATIMRYLQDTQGKEETVSHETLTPETKTMQRIEKDLLKLKQMFSGSEITPEQQKLIKKIPSFLKALDAVKQ